MGRIIRGVVLAAAVMGMAAPAASAQDTPQKVYFDAIARYFDITADEVVVLSEWRLEPDEIPVVMFMAERAGVSPEALVALRRSGKGWSQLAGQYRVDASHFHVPIPDTTPAGTLEPIYKEYRARPADRWSEVSMQDSDIVVLVNVRMLAEVLKLPPEQILGAHRVASSFIDLYVELLRSASR